jgi:hypothetical protein
VRISSKTSLDVPQESEDIVCKEFRIPAVSSQSKDYFWAKLRDKLDKGLPIILRGGFSKRNQEVRISKQKIYFPTGSNRLLC